MYRSVIYSEGDEYVYEARFKKNVIDNNPDIKRLHDKCIGIKRDNEELSTVLAYMTAMILFMEDLKNEQ